MNNEIYLRRKNRIYIEPNTQTLPLNYISSILKNVENLGYTFSIKLIDCLKTVSIKEITLFYQELVKDLKTLTKADKAFSPMYPNFPKQVMEMSQAELYFNAIIHYLTGLLPEYEKQERIPLLDRVDLKVIDLGGKEDFEKIFTKLASAKTSISEQDKLDLAWFIKSYKDNIVNILPSESPNKEVATYLAGLLINNTSIANLILPSYIKTATDVLRLAVALSDGDVSLAENTKFKTFKRSQRKLLLELLEKSSNITEDMLRWKGRWIRLGEKLHVGEFAKKFPKSFEAFDIIRNSKPFQTFNGKVESSLQEGNSESVVELLNSRPGDFARRLDHILRINKSNSKNVLSKFAEIANKVSAPVLLQVSAHFNHRNSQQDIRTFFPKGNVAKVQSIKYNLKELSIETCLEVVSICEKVLTKRFSSLPSLGKCFLDKKLKNYLVPFSQRSANKTLRTIVRGSKLDLPKSKVIRFFLWWTNGNYRTDIDLSAVFYDEKFNYVDTLSYYNLKSYGAHHSGDITDAPEGAAEFIDVDIEKLLESNIRYVLMSINSYTEQPFCDLPECFAGWMARTHPDSGEIFEARTVQDRIDVASDTKICVPVIIDLKDKKAIWADIGLKNTASLERVNNVKDNLRGISLMLKAIMTLVKPNLYDLFALHIKARGEFVENLEEAENIFSPNNGITPFDIEIITSEYLT